MRLALLAAVLLLAACSGGDAPVAPPGTPASPSPGPSETTPPPDLPESMAALGDSITRAFLACGAPTDCPAVSWSTGAEVDSHAARLGRLRGTEVAVHNVAVSGARVSDLPAQARRAVETKAEYVTVLIGANDACRPNADAMTPVDAYARDFGRALDTLARGLPDARILVLSIPDLRRLWDVGAEDERARAVWRDYGICRSALAPDAPRDRVRERVRAYNKAMAEACARHRNCKWDGEAVFRHAFRLTDVSALDYWHPSRTGQETLAEVAWRAGFWSGG
jgi:lysophospholipase L1-like esterase